MNTQHHATDDTAGLLGPDDKFITSEGGYRLDTRRPMHCTGPCDQGRKGCPHPQACQRPEPEKFDPHVNGVISVCVWLVMAILAVAAAWHMAGVAV